MDAEDEQSLDIFEEPKDFYKPAAEATFATHKQLNGEDVTVRLVGHNALWGHFLWNAGRTISLYIEERAQELIAGRTVLEFGAGAGLPSLICALHGAAEVVVTDYPDADLVENLQYNIDHGLPGEARAHIKSAGYLWGADPQKILSLPSDEAAKDGFDVLILADLLFNHSEHKKLVQSVQRTLKKSSTAVALVFFTPYRPWLLEKDLAFFDLAREAGFTVERILEKVMDKVMFDEDPGDELLRRTVYGYSVKWASPNMH